LLGGVGAAFYGAFDHPAAYLAMRWAAAVALGWIGFSVMGLAPSLAGIDRFTAPITGVLQSVKISTGASGAGALVSGMIWDFCPAAMVYGALFYAMLSGGALGGAEGDGRLRARHPAVGHRVALGMSGFRKLANVPRARMAVGSASWRSPWRAWAYGRYPRRAVHAGAALISRNIEAILRFGQVLPPVDRRASAGHAPVIQTGSRTRDAENRPGVIAGHHISRAMRTKPEFMSVIEDQGEHAKIQPITSSRRSPRLRQRVAWMYYVEEMTQSAIADALGIGRITVVRLLSEARAMTRCEFRSVAMSRCSPASKSAFRTRMRSRSYCRAFVGRRRRPASRHRGGGGRVRLGHAAARHESRARLGDDAQQGAELHQRAAGASALRGFAARRHHPRAAGQPR